MKKLLLTAVLILSTSVCFAMAVNPYQIPVKPDILIPDSTVLTGTDYDGKVAIFNGATVAINSSYVREILVVTYENSVLVRYQLGQIPSNYCPTLPANEQGKIGRVAYKTFTDSLGSWSIQSGAGNPVATFEENGVVMNADKFLSVSQTQDGRYIEKKMSKCPTQIKQNGIFPQWRALVDFSVSIAEAETLVPALKSWAAGSIPVVEADGTNIPDGL